MNTATAVFYAVYDNWFGEIDRVYESRRDCEERCDDLNSWIIANRYVVEPVPACEWDDEHVWWAA